MDNTNKDFFVYKIILVGDSGVGKSNIVRRFTTNQSPANIQPTIGTEYHTKEVDIGGNVKIKAQIWDTAGQERYKSITTSKAKGAILVYDITNRQSFESLKRWISELQFHAGEDVKILLAGNKVDLSNQRQVSESEGQSLARDYNLLFMETSAHENKCITESFEKLLTTVHNTFKNAKEEGKDDLMLENKNSGNDNKGGCNC